MPTRLAVAFGLALLVSAAAIAAKRQPEPARAEPAKAESAGAQAARPTTKFDEAKALAELRKEIAGKENEPADKVFMDIDLMQGVTAGQLLVIMETGYARPLGVTCTHCHTPGEWQANDKKQKEAARGMIQMTAKINNELLPKIKGLDTDHRPEVNCTTCHRGQVRPALRMP